MSRPIRIEFANALYHVTSRGDRREAIFEDDDDRLSFLQTLGQVVEQFNWLCYAWCLMDNHYHLLIQTPDGNLSKGMRQLNGVFTQLSNRRYRRVGHLFQGRFKAILVDSDAYLLELARYVVLNPVRAGMVKNAAHWRWSSYRASMGLVPAETFLAVDGLLAQFAARRSLAQTRYAQFVAEGIMHRRLGNNSRGRCSSGMNTLLSKCKATLPSITARMCKFPSRTAARLQRHCVRSTKRRGIAMTLSRRLTAQGCIRINRSRIILKYTLLQWGES